MSKKQSTSSKRQLMREQRQKKQRQQRVLFISAVVIVVLGLAALIIIPSIQNAAAPVGNIVEITPRSLPQANGLSLGEPNAPVKVDVYEDFQCPICRNFTEQIEPQLVKNDIATGKVYYTFHQFPFLDDRAPTNESHQAANASMCASEQGRFWDYHDMLFANWTGENVGSFTDKRLAAFAEKLGLNMDQFNTCFKENKYQSQINADLAAGQKAGVQGTPSIFVNGKIVEPVPGQVPTYTDIQAAIDNALTSK